MDEKNQPTDYPTTLYRLGQVEQNQKDHAIRLGGLELWKAKVEDIIKEKPNATTGSGKDEGDATTKDWIKILIVALTIISGLVALLAQVLK